MTLGKLKGKSTFLIKKQYFPQKETKFKDHIKENRKVTKNSSQIKSH